MPIYHTWHLIFFWGDSESAISSTFLGLSRLSSVIIMQILLLFFLCLLCLLFFFLSAPHESYVCVCVRVETKEVRNLSTAG